MCAKTVRTSSAQLQLFPYFFLFFEAEDFAFFLQNFALLQAFLLFLFLLHFFTYQQRERFLGFAFAIVVCAVDVLCFAVVAVACAAKMLVANNPAKNETIPFLKYFSILIFR